jgi:hypothetical protein
MEVSMKVSKKLFEKAKEATQLSAELHGQHEEDVEE